MQIAIIFYSYSQYDNVWMMGHYINPSFPKGKIEFSNGVPDTFSIFRTMPFYRTNASICDQSGNVLFYTNGVYIANRNHDTLENSVNFNPGYYTNLNPSGIGYGYSAIIIPNPDDSAQYYVFHKTADTIIYQGVPRQVSISLRYSEVDMMLDNGLGGITTGRKSINIVSDTLNRGLLMACKHGNGRDWWVLVPSFNDSLIYKVLVTPDTMIVSSQVTGSQIYYDVSGSSIFSPDGSKYVLMTQNNLLDIFDFDRCNGILSNHSVVHLPDTIYAYYGAAISADNRYLYVNTQTEIYQLDLTSNPYSSSIIQVAQWDTAYLPFQTYFGLNQLGPDGKIYIATTNGCHILHIIEQPDSGGLACNVLQNTFTLAGPGGNSSVPAFPNYSLGPLTGSACDTLTTIPPPPEKISNFKIYPNPVTNNILNIGYQLPYNKSGTFKIYDVTGKVVFKYTLPQWSTLQKLNIKNISAGIYFCTITSNGYTVTKKLVICGN